ncbi:inorganic diphosphatase [Rickettsiales endosymbiont of Stachyamoeba lipophora]|uniref:inorganic diphosphatase n=1 Tax=Rickettsiales endosymbiont of Stachyamoeba lipophora TaxID=2486578 RepID=UPI000F652D15|nr:inorganic diphosphatase [Rickettsiales endosymbiont of Stachyamoeba lipophora]AZL16414.1 inorganic diphosphatase [Rickettsiales endosymbiont of Stachyamoeba lipophora]
MDISQVPAGKQLPEEFNVIIEIPMSSQPIKYEMDKDSGALFVDRFLQTSMLYPCNYGFIPNTLSGDGDPADVLVITRIPVMPGSVIKARAIGVLMMEDESGIDEKILAVPVTKLDSYYENVKSYQDLPKIFLDQINHFFEHYKDLEKGKWVKITGWESAEHAKEIITKAVENNNA